MKTKVMRLSNNSQKSLLIIGALAIISAILFVASKPNSITTRTLIEPSVKQATIHSSISISSPKPTATVVDNKSQLIEAERRYQNLISLMSQSVSELTEAEKQIAIDKILSELPLVVSDGKMSPINAVFVHTTLLERQNVAIDPAMVKELESKYNGLYPSDDKAPRSEHDLE